jgi:hypothetical protein
VTDWAEAVQTVGPVAVAATATLLAVWLTQRSTADRDAALWRRDRFHQAAEGFLVACRQAIEDIDSVRGLQGAGVEHADDLRRALHDADMGVRIFADRETLKAAVKVRQTLPLAMAFPQAADYVEPFRDAINAFHTSMRRQLGIPDADLSAEDDPGGWATRPVGM